MARKGGVCGCIFFILFQILHMKKKSGEVLPTGISVSLSHEILPEFREYERTSTTVINGYVSRN
jgi:N-methylhydantoinase A